MRSVIKEIEKHIAKHPEKLLFAFLDIKGEIKESYTYGDFEPCTKHIAAHIQRNVDLVQGDRVLLAYAPGIEMIWAFFACVRLGLIPVPVYPPAAQGLEASVQKMNFIAQDCGAKAVLTDRSCYWSYKVNLSRGNSFVSQLQWIATDDTGTEHSVVLPEVQQEILFLQYTSGSTDYPKGVMVSHENIIQNCANVVDHMPVGVSWLPQYHDMGLIGYYLFFAVKGGTTYGFSPSDFIQRPALWLESITKFKATASSAPNFAYEYCLLSGKISEEVLSKIELGSLTFLMTASEPIKPIIYNSFLEKYRQYGLKAESFFGAYGLAEFTLAVSNYGRKFLSLNAELLKQGIVEIVKGDEKNAKRIELMSCGKILHDTHIRIVDVENGNTEAAGNKTGEIWLDGASKCKGYWNKPELSKEVFEAELKDASGSNKWLRTGDLGFMYEGELYVCGRIKDLIIVRGLNYYPQDIEGIVEKDPLLRKGSVIAFSVEKGGDESLIVLAGLKNPTKIPDANAIHLQVQQYLGISIAEILFVPAKSIPKTSSGKLRRSESKKSFLQNETSAIAHVLFDTNEEEKQRNPENENTAVVNEKAGGKILDYQQILKRYKLVGLENVALGDAGLDSIKLAEFGHDLKLYLEENGFDDLSQEVDLKLLQRIVVAELFAVIKELQSATLFAKFKFRKTFMKIQAEYDKSESDQMKRDALLPPLLKPFAAKEQNEAASGNILLTGGTGFFGPFLIKSLLEQNSEDIFVLVRADSVSEGMKRLRDSFNKINPSANFITAFESRVKPVRGDLSKPKLGLSNSDWKLLTSNVHSIYHNGACVNYIMNYETMRSSSVAGTKEIIQLSTSGRRKTLNHISTTFIFGWSVKETLWEHDANDAMELLDFGYSQTKWVADQLVLKAMKQGIDTRIFRPALISPSLDGDGYNFDISMRLLSFMLQYGIGTSAGNQVSFTPADLAANNIVAISNLNESLNKVFHVTRDEYAAMKDVTDLLGSFAGKTFKNYDLKSFVPEIVSRCTKQDLLFPLLNFLVKSVDNITAMEFKRYDNSNYQHFRRQSTFGKEDPPLEEVVKGIYLFMKKNKEISEKLVLV